MQKEIDQLKHELVKGKHLDEKVNNAVDDKESFDQKAFNIGGALRFQYSNGSFNKERKRHYGAIDFDTFRLDINGQYAGLIYDVQWRWYEYMTALHHAWIGYQFAEHSHMNTGLILIPFGNQAYNSHNLFFSSNYYLGLEDSVAAYDFYDTIAFRANT